MCMVQGVRCRVQGLGISVQSEGCRVSGVRQKIWRLGLRVDRGTSPPSIGNVGEEMALWLKSSSVSFPPPRWVRLPPGDEARAEHTADAAWCGVSDSGIRVSDFGTVGIPPYRSTSLIRFSSVGIPPKRPPPRSVTFLREDEASAEHAADAAWCVGRRD